jgi:hypothetical protein
MGAGALRIPVWWERQQGVLEKLNIDNFNNS